MIRWQFQTILWTAVFLLASHFGAFKAPLRAASPPWQSTFNDAEFFESKVRPLLIEHCQECHGTETQKGGLRLDSRHNAIELGGDSGEVIAPGDPEASLLIEAIRYDSFIQMPPSGKLDDAEIETLLDWIRRGAAWPESGPSNQSRVEGVDDFSSRAAHWSYQRPQPVEVPTPEHPRWVRNPIDAFILERLEATGIEPSEAAPGRTRYRRLHFDLTGLPPTPQELQSYLEDQRPGAFERAVDRLLASPSYGEAWGRHWLDLVRYAETSGHEFDYDILSAYRYRDYIIRAWNDDIPYDQLIREQIAGDLMTEPRRRPITDTNESVLGTTSYFLTEGTHSPVDIREDMRARVDNQIDVFGKTFLGLTIACARCHDHKFDPIRTEDYYALAGYFESTRHQYLSIDAPERIERPAQEIDQLLSEISSRIQELPLGCHPDRSERDRLTQAPNLRDDEEVFARFDSTAAFDSWYPSGLAFGDRPTVRGDVLVVDARATKPRLLELNPGWAQSSRYGANATGVLRSKTFTIQRRFIDLLAVGTGGRINLVIDGFEKIRAPIYGGLTRAVDHGNEARWIRIDASMWQGHRAFLELSDGATSNYTSGKTSLWPGDGTLGVSLILFSDHDTPLGSPESWTSPFIDREFEVDSSELPSDLKGMVKAVAAKISGLPQPTLVLAAAEGSGVDVPVHIRGSSKNLGDLVPRRFLEVLQTEDQLVSEAPADESGRAALAERIASPSNPLTARVIVNRLWQHHFGRGIVASPDNFGVSGQPPTHPELLDWLALELIRSNWSVKHLQRLIVTSSTYQQSSHFRPELEEVDPTNVLYHRQSIRRIPAESVRDTILRISGSLDRRMFGPSVPTHLTSFMQGRGRPSKSGPLDGEGRRSLYLNVRRNFLSPFLLAFDYPAPASTIGKRTSSNVPSQALALLNDPFVVQESERWATRILKTEGSLDDHQRIDQLYFEAFGRVPASQERIRAIRFIESQQAQGLSKLDTWTTLCHALLNAKELIWIQ